jgi:hypothetical protein
LDGCLPPEIFFPAPQLVDIGTDAKPGKFTSQLFGRWLQVEKKPPPPTVTEPESTLEVHAVTRAGGLKSA